MKQIRGAWNAARACFFPAGGDDEYVEEELNSSTVSLRERSSAGAGALAKAPNENRWKASGCCRATSLDPGRRATKYRLNFSESVDDAVDSMKKQIAWVAARTPGIISKSFQLSTEHEMILRCAFPMSSFSLFGFEVRSIAKNPAELLSSFSRATLSPSEELMTGVGHALLKGAMTEENAEERELVEMPLEKCWLGADGVVQISLKACCTW